MKSIYKRVLVVGLSLSLIALAGLQNLKEPEIEGENDDDGPGIKEKKLGPIPMPDPETRPRPSAPVQVFPSATKVTLSGRLVPNGSGFVFREMGGTLYTLSSIGHPLPSVGQDVRITGKLDLSRGLLQVDDIEPFEDLALYYPRAAS